MGKGEVIPCWDVAFQHIKIGQKARINCPYATAYGEKGIPDKIPEKANLTFDVEVLELLHSEDPKDNPNHDKHL